MSFRKDTKKIRITPTLATSEKERDAEQAPASGRVGFNTRGQAVWEMRAGDANFVRDASTTLVKNLQTPELSIEATAIAKPVVAAAAKAEEGNPYDRNPHATMNPELKRSKRPPMRYVVIPQRGPSLFERLLDKLSGRK